MNNNTLFTLDITQYVDIEKPRFKVELIGHTEHANVEDHFDSQVLIDDILESWENEFKWFMAEIKVTCTITDLSDSAYLGCCSYNDENDLLESLLPDYGQDMVDEAKAGLLTEIEGFKAKLSKV